MLCMVGQMSMPLELVRQPSIFGSKDVLKVHALDKLFHIQVRMSLVQNGNLATCLVDQEPHTQSVLYVIMS